MKELTSLNLLYDNKEGYFLNLCAGNLVQPQIQDGRHRHFEKNIFHLISKMFTFSFGFRAREHDACISILI